MPPWPSTRHQLSTQLPDDDVARVWLADVRWSGGFICPVCAGTKAWDMSEGVRRCAACKRRIGPLAHTSLDRSRVPTVALLDAIWAVAATSGTSARALAVANDISEPAALHLLARIRGALIERMERTTLDREVEVDETYLGRRLGQRNQQRGVKRGRGAPGKVALAVAVERRKGGSIAFRIIDKATRKELHDFIQDHVAPGAEIHTDGLTAYRGLDKLGYRHVATNVAGSGAPAHVPLPMIHQVASTLKRRLLATHHRYPSRAHWPGYLAEFAFRFDLREKKPADRFRALVDLLLAPVEKRATAATGAGGSL